MKRLYFLLILTFLNISNDIVCSRRASQNFGTTHFIIGYQKKNKPVKRPKDVKIIDEQEPIINGSSVHLLDDSRLVQSFFPSVHNIPSIILEILAQAQKSIKIAAFALTDKRISNQLIEAHKKGVDVSVIMDANNAKMPYSKGRMLADNKISVKYYEPKLRCNYKKKQFVPLMHRKCCIVDSNIVITGSTNLTNAGLTDNAEDINVIRCKTTVKEQKAEYKRLDQCSVKLRLE